MAANEKYIIDNEDREFFGRHYEAIAERLMQKRLFRGPWSIEVNGCVFKFTVKGYAKKNTPIWTEQQQELERARA
jgi:hypothetical protein